MTRLPRLVLAVACALALTGCTGAAGSEAPSGPQLKTIDTDNGELIEPLDRTPAPSLAGDTLDGEPLDVADLRGSVVVINFWASWCGPCRAEADNLIAVAQATEDDGVRFVGVNVKDGTVEAQAFERNREVPYPSIEDQPGALLTRFRTLVPQTPPTTLLLDREGRIAARFIGGVTEDELMAPVLALASEAGVQ